MIKWRRLGMTVAVIASMFAVETATAAPASATPAATCGGSLGYAVCNLYSATTPGISPVNLWPTFPELYQGGSSANSPYVRMWQYILWNKYTFDCEGGTNPGHGMSCYCPDFVDGSFGPNTNYWTQRWQSDMRGLSVDGRVGPHTWGKAATLATYYSYTSPWYYWRYADTGVWIKDTNAGSYILTTIGYCGGNIG